MTLLQITIKASLATDMDTLVECHNWLMLHLRSYPPDDMCDVSNLINVLSERMVTKHNDEMRRILDPADLKELN